MKVVWIIGGCVLLLLAGCLHEVYRGDDCLWDEHFVMRDIPYVFVGKEAVDYRPYYTFIEQLDLFIFSEQHLEQYDSYNFEYCREHPVITQEVDDNSRDVLFVANLYSQKELQWNYHAGHLEAVFSILDYEEPPVLLAAIADIASRRDSVPVELRLMVSRLEIYLVNPPSWLVGLDVLVHNIAGTVSTDYVLGDTTYIHKALFFDNQGSGAYLSGVNTFPTYSGKAALLKITPLGMSGITPILVEDGRLHFFPGVITRVEIVYDADEKITISIRTDGKWEVIDGGSIII